MNSSIKKVFLVIGILVLAFLIWGLFFNDGGILQTSYNSLAEAVNHTWQKVTGDSGAKLLPEIGNVVDTDTNLQEQNNAF